MTQTDVVRLDLGNSIHHIWLMAPWLLQTPLISAAVRSACMLRSQLLFTAVWLQPNVSADLKMTRQKPQQRHTEVLIRWDLFALWWGAVQCHSFEPSDWEPFAAADPESLSCSLGLHPHHLLSPLCSLLSALHRATHFETHDLYWYKSECTAPRRQIGKS